MRARLCVFCAVDGACMLVECRACEGRPTEDLLGAELHDKGLAADGVLEQLRAATLESVAEAIALISQHVESDLGLSNAFLVLGNELVQLLPRGILAAQHPVTEILIAADLLLKGGSKALGNRHCPGSIICLGSGRLIRTLFGKLRLELQKMGSQQTSGTNEFSPTVVLPSIPRT